jgi:4-hydroxy-2-oxoheptanedioate aldolase
MPRINKAIELLSQGQPVYMLATRELTYANGVKLARTFADIVRLDIEHDPFNMEGMREFMRGMVDGGPTASGHRTPTVIAELPTDGTDEATMRANAWMAKHVLAAGVHGIMLCHAETPGAVRALVEATRYSFQKLGVGEQLSQGRRGNGGQNFAAQMWGLSPSDYLRKADVWPLNPDGEIMIGLKIENLRALANVEKTLTVPGIAFAEWGPGDMGMALGLPEAHDPPYSPEMAAIRTRVFNAIRANQLSFFDLVTPDDLIAKLDDGLMICGTASAEQAARGRTHTKRPTPW